MSEFCEIFNTDFWRSLKCQEDENQISPKAPHTHTHTPFESIFNAQKLSNNNGKKHKNHRFYYRRMDTFFFCSVNVIQYTVFVFIHHRTHNIWHVIRSVVDLYFRNFPTAILCRTFSSVNEKAEVDVSYPEFDYLTLLFFSIHSHSRLFLCVFFAPNYIIQENFYFCACVCVLIRFFFFFHSVCLPSPSTLSPLLLSEVLYQSIRIFHIVLFFLLATLISWQLSWIFR